MPESLHAGPLTAVFDPQMGSLRRICLDGEEVIRHVYAAVRDENWATLPMTVNVKNSEVRGGGFAIELVAKGSAGPAEYGWTMHLAGSSAGEITINFRGVAGGSFLRNRIGLCVLHPIAGGAFQAEHPEGGVSVHAFPSVAISPWQPATDLQALSWTSPRGAVVRLEFAGDLFEMEDQRNWGDHSLKTYCTPQHFPKPVKVLPGDEVRQTVRIRITPPRKLKIGLVAHPDCNLARSAVRDRLRELALDHMRVDLRLQDADWQERLRCVGDLALDLGVGLHAALFLTDDFPAELPAVRKAVERFPVSLILVFHERKTLTPPHLLVEARRVFGERVALAGGTDGLFCELNREPPSPQADWLPCFSVIPQAHLTDEATMVENVPATRDALSSLALITGQEAVVSPVTLAPRFPMDAWFGGALETWQDSPPDARQEGEFGAGWLRAFLTSLRGAGNLRGVTVFATHGPGGILSAEGTPRPAWQVLKEFADSGAG